jgi:hypothetical protein
MAKITRLVGEPVWRRNCEEGVWKERDVLLEEFRLFRYSLWYRHEDHRERERRMATKLALREEHLQKREAKAERI